jgi:hypothetical protein
MIESEFGMTKATTLLLIALLLEACATSMPAPTQMPMPITSSTARRSVVSAPTGAATIAQDVTLPTASAPVGLPTPRAPVATPTKARTLSDQTIGVSAAYPPDWEILPRAPDDPPGLTLHGPSLGEGPEPIIFAITVEVEPVTEKSVRDIVNQQLEQVPSDLRGEITRRSLNVGGEPADQVIGLPSQGGALETFVLHGGQLFLIILQPYDESNESLVPYLAQVRSVYGDFLSSWKFLKESVQRRTRLPTGSGFRIHLKFDRPRQWQSKEELFSLC